MGNSKRELPAWLTHFIIAECGRLAFYSFSAFCSAPPLRRAMPSKLLRAAGWIISTAKGSGQLALYSEVDLGQAHPRITRAIIIFPGLRRNATGRRAGRTGFIEF
jgi:hypothetical protein